MFRAILSRENQMFKSIVLRWHAMGKDLRAWSRLFYSAILYLDEQHPYLTLVSAYIQNLHTIQSLFNLLLGVSDVISFKILEL